MKAICLQCQNVIEFRLQRGNKLSNYKCKCGGSFHPLRSDYEVGRFLNWEKDIYKVKTTEGIKRFERTGDNKYVLYVPPAEFFKTDRGGEISGEKVPETACPPFARFCQNSWEGLNG